MRTRITLCAVALAAGGLGMGFGAGDAMAEELIFNSYLPPMNITRKIGVEDFAAAIEAQSGGEITVTVPDATLAPEDQQYSMLLDGVADMGFLATDDLSQMVALNGIADLPHMAPTSKAASVALWETYRKYFEARGEYKGMKVLSTHVLAGRQILGLDRQYVSVEDLRGVKFWVTNGPLTRIMQSVGVVPVDINFPELFESVSKGLVDGLITAPGSALSARVLDKVHHITEVPGGLGSVSFAVVISAERWQALSESEQAAILRAADGLPGRVGGGIDMVEDKAHQIAGESMDTIAAPEALMAALEPALQAQIDAWKDRASKAGLEDPDEVLAFYKSVLERETAAN